MTEWKPIKSALLNVEAQAHFDAVKSFEPPPEERLDDLDIAQHNHDQKQYVTETTPSIWTNCRE